MAFTGRSGNRCASFSKNPSVAAASATQVPSTHAPAVSLPGELLGDGVLVPVGVAVHPASRTTAATIGIIRRIAASPEFWSGYVAHLNEIRTPGQALAPPLLPFGRRRVPAEQLGVGLNPANGDRAGIRHQRIDGHVGGEQGRGPE